MVDSTASYRGYCCVMPITFLSISCRQYSRADGSIRATAIAAT
jgi:hypothetical protein